MRSGVISMNEHKNSLVNFSVYNLYYDYSSEIFNNLSSILDKIKEKC